MPFKTLLTPFVALSLAEAGFEATEKFEQKPGAEVLSIAVLVASLCFKALFKVSAGVCVSGGHRISLHSTLVCRRVYLTDQRRAELERLVTTQRVTQHVPDQPNKASDKTKHDVKRLDRPCRL